MLTSQKEVQWVVWVTAPKSAHCPYWCTHSQSPLTCVKHPTVLVVSTIYHVAVAVKMCGKS